MEDDRIINAYILDFTNLFIEPEHWRPNWEDEGIKKLSEEEKKWAERPFTMEELVIKSFKGDKAPGLDGFNLCFFQKCWSIVKRTFGGLWIIFT